MTSELMTMTGRGPKRVMTGWAARPPTKSAAEIVQRASEDCRTVRPSPYPVTVGS